MKKRTFTTIYTTTFILLISLGSLSSVLAISAHAVDPEPDSTRTMALEEWWTIFQDASLDSLMQVGLDKNLDLRAMVSRVEEARNRIRIAESYWYPNVQVGAGFSQQNLAPNRPISIRQQSEDEALPRFLLNTYQVPLEVSYEVDLWQRVKNQVKTSKLVQEATEEAYLAAQLTITTEIARLYYLLRSNDTEMQVLQKGLVLRDSTLKIAKARYDAGLVNETDVQRAETEIANVQVQMEAVQRSRAELELSLAVLLGATPGSLSVGTGLLPEALPKMPDINTENLVFKRPDLRQSERLIAAANTQIDVERSALLPKLNLYGSAGLISREVSTLFSGASTTYLIGGSISIPLFEGGRLKNNISLAKQEVQTASLDYQQRVLTASREVQTAMTNLEVLTVQQETQQRALASAQKTRLYARELYLRGLTSFLEAVDAERTALELERQAVDLKGQQVLYTIGLVKALGGSW